MSLTFFTGEALAQHLAKKHVPSPRRNIFKALRSNLNQVKTDRICVLYGLRRTGKTVLMYQLMKSLGLKTLKNKCAFISFSYGETNMRDLRDAISNLEQKGIEYIFLDEVTYVTDFINSSSYLANIFSGKNAHVVMAGTDSLGFVFAEEGPLFDRVINFHTTHISFQEHSRITGKKGIDDYISWGGIFRGRLEVDEDLPVQKEHYFSNSRELKKYIDSAIAENILHALKMDVVRDRFGPLRELDDDTLICLVNRIVHDENHRFFARTITSAFASHDFGVVSAEYARSENQQDEEISRILLQIDKNELNRKLAHTFTIIERERLGRVPTDYQLFKLKEYLEKIDVIRPHRQYTIFGNAWALDKNDSYNILSQPGMRYCQAKETAEIFAEDVLFENADAGLLKVKKEIANKILEQVKGQLLEEIVTYNLMVNKPENYEIFKLKFDKVQPMGDIEASPIDGEFDIVVRNKDDGNCALYEVKHSRKRIDNQAVHLRNELFCQATEGKIGRIASKTVIYRGKNYTAEDGVIWQNVENFLGSYANNFINL